MCPKCRLCFRWHFNGFASVDGAPEGIGFSGGGALVESPGCFQRQLVPHEQVHERAVEQTVAFPVPPVME